MPKYSVEMTYTCTTTYNGTVEVSAKNEEEAEEKALAKVEASGLPSDWEQNEDGGDFEVESVEEA
jgi:hypothetical protein